MFFPFEKLLIDNLKTYGLAKIFHLINSKNLPGKLYAKAAPGF